LALSLDIDAERFRESGPRGESVTLRSYGTLASILTGGFMPPARHVVWNRRAKQNVVFSTGSRTVTCREQTIKE
jgi:hypothetical protein